VASIKVEVEAVGGVAAGDRTLDASFRGCNDTYSAIDRSTVHLIGVVSGEIEVVICLLVGGWAGRIAWEHVRRAIAFLNESGGAGGAGVAPDFWPLSACYGTIANRPN
jgi:hypothetical protein